MMIQTLRLDYTDNDAHISALNKILAGLPKPYPPEMQETVDFILNRMIELQTAQVARLVLYDQRNP
jgi:hypothetical protein